MSNNNKVGVYPVKFRDLVNELAKLCEMDYKKDIIGFYVTTSVCYYGRYNLDEMIKLMNDKEFNFRYGHDYLHLLLYGKKNNRFSFFYNIIFKLNFNELECDGKSLLDYSRVINGNTHLKKLNYSKIDIDDNIDNLVLYFDDSILSKEECRDFYPVSLLKDAVDNCKIVKKKIRKT